jgi:hypothetical protein
MDAMRFLKDIGEISPWDSLTTAKIEAAKSTDGIFRLRIRIDCHGGKTDGEDSAELLADDSSAVAASKQCIIGTPSR